MSKGTILIVFLLACAFVAALFFFVFTNRGLEREVENINTGKIYASIQEAIDARDTLNGHTLFVHPGKYVESVNITKTLTVKGMNVSSTIIEKGRKGLAAVTVCTENSTIANFTVTSSTIGIQCFHTTGSRILNNRIGNCSTGIEAYFSNTTLIGSNEVFNGTLRGIHIYNSSFTIVMNNSIENISEAGKAISAIHIQHSRNNTLVQNQLLRNICGVQLEAGASNNTIYYNSFINNTRHAIVYSLNNTWDNGYPSGGNYWSGRNFRDIYSGPDQNIPGSDGIQDFLYIIDEYNQDRYPFVSPLNMPIDTLYDG